MQEVLKRQGKVQKTLIFSFFPFRTRFKTMLESRIKPPPPPHTQDDAWASRNVWSWKPLLSVGVFTHTMCCSSRSKLWRMLHFSRCAALQRALCGRGVKVNQTCAVNETLTVFKKYSHFTSPNVNKSPSLNPYCVFGCNVNCKKTQTFHDRLVAMFGETDFGSTAGEKKGFLVRQLACFPLRKQKLPQLNPFLIIIQQNGWLQQADPRLFSNTRKTQNTFPIFVLFVLSLSQMRWESPWTTIQACCFDNACKQDKLLITRTN